MKFKINSVDSMSLLMASKSPKRDLTITKGTLNKTLYVYNGKKDFKVKITNKHIGHKLGEFSFTRKIGKIHTNKK